MSDTFAPALSEERFLAALRERVAWQSRAAERRRAEELVRPQPVDVLNVAELIELVERDRTARRYDEWRAFLDELAELTESGGRLPAMLERLVRVVFAELL